MNISKVVENFSDDEDIELKQKQKISTKARVAQIISRLEIIRGLMQSREFRKFRRLITEPMAQGVLAQLKNPGNLRKDPEHFAWLQGHLAALEKYFDLEQLESHYQRELVRAQDALANKPQDNGEENQ